MKAIRHGAFVPLFVIGLWTARDSVAADPRIREVIYDPRAVVTVPVKRGVVTHVLLLPDEAITDVASGLGSDCAKSEASWCVSAQVGGRNLFVKAKSSAGAPNNVAVVTDRRTHAFLFTVLPDTSTAPPVYRLTLSAPAVRLAATAVSPAAPDAAPMPVVPSNDATAVLAERLSAQPLVVNARYSIAEGSVSSAIVPTLVFDDGRFTYLRFGGNREVPAVFQVLDDGGEVVVNTRMEGDLLVVDRTSPRLVLRAGPAVVAVWNDAFDADGHAPTHGTTVTGVERAMRNDRTTRVRTPLDIGKAP